MTLGPASIGEHVGPISTVWTPARAEPATCAVLPVKARSGGFANLLTFSVVGDELTIVGGNQGNLADTTALEFARLHHVYIWRPALEVTPNAVKAEV